MESGAFSQNALLCSTFALFKRFMSLSYRKKSPLSSAFNPHEHELLEPSPPGERPAAAGGEPSAPAKIKQPGHKAGERKPMKRQTKNPKGSDCCQGRFCQHGFWRSSGRGNGLLRQGGAVRPGKNQTARPQCRRERKPMEHNTKNRKGAAA